MRPARRSRRGPVGPSVAISSTRVRRRRRPRARGSAASGAAPESPIARPGGGEFAHRRVRLVVGDGDRAADAGQQRRPGGLRDDRRSRARPSSCPASGSRPARPPASAAVRHAAVVRLDADHGRARRAPRSAPPRRPASRRRSGRGSRPTAPGARRTASRSRRSPTRAGPDAPTSASLEARPAARLGRGARDSVLVGAVDDHDLGALARRSPRAARGRERAGRNTRQRSPRIAATRATARPWLPALAATSVCTPGPRAARARPPTTRRGS